MAYFEFPHTRTYDNDLGWLIWAMKKLISDWEDFSNTNSIKFADPINWTIDRNYEPSTVVLDADGNGYIARQAVPAGVPLSNETYWTEIFSFGDLTTKIRENIAFDEEDSPTATNAYQVGQLLWWQGDLYRVIQAMWAGTAFIVDTNIERTTVEEEIRRVVDEAQEITDDLRDNIAVNNNGSVTAVQALTKGDLVWLDNNLYAAEYDIPIGTELIPGANINLKIVDEKINENAQAAADDREVIRANIATDNNGSSTAIQEYSEGDLIWVDNYLFQAMTDIPIGTAFVPGANISPKTVDEKINDAYTAILEARDYVNVKQFGAVGDGVTNDYDAIMDALRNPAYNTYFFPKGRYYINRRIGLPRAGITLIGEDGACIYTDQDVYSMIEITYGNISIYNLEITMDVERGRNDSRSSCILIHNTHAGTTQEHVTIEKCHIHHANRYGINMETAAERPFNLITIKNCLLHDLWVCIKNGGGMKYERIDGCRMYNSVAEVLTFDGDEKYCTLTNSWLAYNDQGVGLIGADGSSNIIITNNIFYNQNAATNPLANGITFNRHMGTCTRYTIANNQFINCAAGIVCHRATETYPDVGASAITVNDNHFVSCLQDIVIHDIDTRNEFMNNCSNRSALADMFVFDDDNKLDVLGKCKISTQIEVPLTADMMRNDATLYNDTAYNTMYVKNGEVDLPFQITNLANYTNLKQVLQLPWTAGSRQGYPALISQTGAALTVVVNNQSVGFGGSAISNLAASSRVIGRINYKYIRW